MLVVVTVACMGHTQAADATACSQHTAIQHRSQDAAMRAEYVSACRSNFDALQAVIHMAGIRVPMLRFGKHGNTRYFDVVEDACRILMSLPSLWYATVIVAVILPGIRTASSATFLCRPDNACNQHCRLNCCIAGRCSQYARQECLTSTTRPCVLVNCTFIQSHARPSVTWSNDAGFSSCTATAASRQRCPTWSATSMTRCRTPTLCSA